MREIKFRGKCIDKNTINFNKMVFGNLVKVKNKYFVVECLGEDSFIWNEVSIEAVGQYTGLKDKNGKEIYEGDIVDLTYFMTKKRGIVKFGKYKQCDMSNDYECGNQGFYVEVENDKYITWRPDIWFYHSNCIVIGNIYGNPELLGVAE